MNQSEIISALEQQYDRLFQWLENQPDEKFEVNIVGKWSPGQHADHLIKSTAPLNQALRMPKMALRTMFGKNNREERSFEAVVEKYTQKIQEGGRASGRFEPKFIANDKKASIIAQLREELQQLSDIILKWDDKKRSNYLLPHPLIGKMTINEMLYFTMYHTEYHIKLLERDYSQA